MLNNISLNIAHFLSKYFEKVANSAKDKIVMGGLITRLDESIRYERELESLHIFHGNITLDLEVYLTMTMISRKDDRYVLMICNKEKRNVFLPNPTLTILIN